MADTSTFATGELANISSGVKYLGDGYIEYCQEVITDRALPSIRDGLKPVQRRILFTLANRKDKGSPVKSARLAGDVLALHPHGDASIYASMVLMTDNNGSMAFPLLKGTGNFSSVIDTEKAAADRYTEVAYPPQADEYFGEMDGVTFVPNFDSTTSEPLELPVSFPAVLVNASSGIAVGFRSNMPSFNFVDVCNLVKEYIHDGKCHTVIMPDFVTGGEYVQDNKELLKLMQTGKAHLVLRGKYVVNGKKIDVIELPYGTKIQNLVTQINNLESDYIKNAYDASDKDHGIAFSVICRNKDHVNEAVYQLYKDTNFQYTYNADMTAIDGGKPVAKGVWGIIESWVTWRREVLEKEYKFRLKNAEQAVRESKAVMAVVNDRAKCLEFVRIVAEEGKGNGAEYLRQNFSEEEVPSDLRDFITGRALSVFNNGGKYKAQFTNYSAEIKVLQNNLADIDAVISKQMDNLIDKYGSQYPRKTQISNISYNFEEAEKKAKAEAVPVKDTSICYYMMRNNFLKKFRTVPDAEPNSVIIAGTASDVLFAIDNCGEILRIYGEDIPYTLGADTGVYLPTYCGVDNEFYSQDNYLLTYISKVEDDKTLTLLYRDGCVGTLDVSELNTAKKSKLIRKGISASEAPYLCGVFDSLPEVIVCTTTDNRLGWFYSKDIQKKGRTAKERMLKNPKKSMIDGIVQLREEDLPFKFNMTYSEKYHGSLVKQNVSEFSFENQELTNV